MLGGSLFSSIDPILKRTSIEQWYIGDSTTQLFFGILVYKAIWRIPEITHQNIHGMSLVGFDHFSIDPPVFCMKGRSEMVSRISVLKMKVDELPWTCRLSKTPPKNCENPMTYKKKQTSNLTVPIRTSLHAGAHLIFRIVMMFFFLISSIEQLWLWWMDQKEWYVLFTYTHMINEGLES